MTPESARRVFVSSTKLDLQSEREAVEDALHQFRRTEYSGMEYFGSQPGKPKEVCLREVAASNIYIGIFGWRYGYVDPETGRSMTELEYREARRLELPCLIYLADESGYPPNPSADEQDSRKILEFRGKLKQTHTLTFFRNPDHLSTRVIVDIANFVFREQMPVAGNEAEWDRKTLHSVLATRLSLEEVKNLTFYLNVDFDISTGKANPEKRVP